MKTCKNFIGKSIKINDRQLIASSGGTEIHKMVLEVGSEWGMEYKPGQFVIIRGSEGAERIPLTVTQYDRQAGLLSLVFQVAGASTLRLSKLEKGQVIEDITHPLGMPVEIHKPAPDKNIAIIIAGGVGIAPAYSKTKALHDAGFDVRLILSARNKGLLIMLDDMFSVIGLEPGKENDRVMLSTDDGSYEGPCHVKAGDGSGGAKDRAMFGVQVLKQVIAREGKEKAGKGLSYGSGAEGSLTDSIPASKIDEIFAVGPIPMMRAVTEATEEMKIPTFVSLNTTMVDGSGMCGGCRVSVEKKDFYVCKDGPNIMAHGYDKENNYLANRLDWAEMQNRGKSHVGMEELSRKLVETGKPVKDIIIQDTAGIQQDNYLLRLAAYLEVDKKSTVGELMEKVKARFGHVAGYLPLEEAVMDASIMCTCPVNDRMKPCQRRCPVDIDIQKFINCLKPEVLKSIAGDGEEGLGKALASALAGDMQKMESVDKQVYEAYRVITASNPIPEITGLVCPQEIQCQQKCASLYRRKEGYMRVTDIGKLEAFVAHWVRVNIGRIMNYSWFETAKPAASTSKKVMVVGSGPGGLVTAAELAMRGHEVTVYETFHEPGGVLIYGIPEFRLPKEIVRYEIGRIADLGVKFELNHPVTDARKYMTAYKYDAAFIATGAGTPSFLGIPGESMRGIYSANEFLTRVNLMKAYNFPVDDTPVPDVLGRKVAVFGGGNVAMDAARCALRLGAEKVTVMYRRSEKEIPARHEEFLAAQDEGINFKYLTTPFEFEGSNDSLKGVHYYDNELGEPDASGRRRPIAIKDKPQFEELDLAVIAIGQDPNKMMDLSAFTRDRKGRIVVDLETMATDLPGIYAGGDIIAENEGTVIYAAGCGLAAANSIDIYLKN